MAIVQRMKEKAGKYFLEREQPAQRERTGTNLSNANSVAFLYEDKDEAYFKQIQRLVRFVHEEYGVRRACALGYVDKPTKQLPIYQLQKLEYMYFTKGDLNWHMKPKVNLMNFLQEPFDILIDLRLSPSVPLDYILRHSKAKMKAGASLSGAEEMYDFSLEVQSGCSLDEYWKQINFYLSNLTLK
ncbi:DUF6913 domain-containing protein [Sanyastnella coralliicola]|uniref:DUF6913 domain-containing protein n=1 Tax=Sanyastnella coralliicola TaxID=3069118 RepID=UPI0027BAF64D|nr:hypothetical protein [Longitalea sp. SCSIO 12813]